MDLWALSDREVQWDQSVPEVHHSAREVPWDPLVLLCRSVREAPVSLFLAVQLALLALLDQVTLESLAFPECLMVQLVPSAQLDRDHR